MSSQSVSQRLHHELRSMISAAKPGERLPSEPKLARELGVSRATLREAMRTFETQGLIRRRQGSGTYVTHTSGVIEAGLERLESIETLAQRKDLPVSIGEWNVERRKANKEEAQALDIKNGAEVVNVCRVILAENRPVAYLVDVLPVEILDPDELGDNFSGSVLDHLLERGQPPLNSSRTEINAVTASRKVARALGIQRGDVLLFFTAYLYGESGRVVDYSFSYFLPGYFRFHVVRRVGRA